MEQENPAPNGREMIDDFRLRGSRPWRRINAPLTKTGWRIQVVHDFDNRNSALSEGAALAVVVQAVPGNPHWKRVSTDCQRRLRQPWRGGGWHVPGASWCRTGGGGSGESDPGFFAAGAASGRVSRFTSQFTVNPPLAGRSLHSAPGGKAKCGRPGPGLSCSTWS